MQNKFHYDGRDPNGNTVSGNLMAKNIEEVISHLKQHNVTPLNINPIKQYTLNYHFHFHYQLYLKKLNLIIS